MPLHQAGRLREAEAIYRRVLNVDPDHADANQLMGALRAQAGKCAEAVDFMTRAIAKDPDQASYHSNLGAVLQKLGRLEEAAACHRKALSLDPRFADAHYNLGNALAPLGRIEEAVASYHKALNIQPDYTGAWNNLNTVAKALRFPQARGDRRDDLYKAGLGRAARATSDFALLEYCLAGSRPHEADESFATAMAALPAKTGQEVTGNGNHSAPPTGPGPRIPDKMVALLHSGRSGSGLLHGLIDGHPEISTLPSIYLRGYFNAGVWEDIAAEGRHGLPGRFADAFEVLFDATSPQPTPGRLGDIVPYLGRKEGMTSLGEGRDEALSLDRDIFCAEAMALMNHFEKIDPGVFLNIVHGAFEKTIGSETEKHTVFYHIHNPDDYAKVNFLRYLPDARLVMMVREPIQSCESWIRSGFEKNDYDHISHRILAMLYDIDQIPFRTQKSLGIRLEDLKRRPEETLRALCKWLGVAEPPSLYETTAQGKKWWGDPSSPEYDKTKDISPFDEAPIARAVGAIFSDRDQLILRTLYYPFCVRFGYRQPDPVGFERNLREIRPQLDEPLDFEQTISERLGIDPAQFTRRETYRMFHGGLLDRWSVLDELGDYPGMLTPLDIHD